MSNFFLKHFALITASRIFIVGNHSDIRKNQLHTKHVAKMFSWNTFLLSEYIFKAVVNQRESIIKNAIAEKTLNRLLQLFIFVILFEMHERVTSMEKEFETVFVDNKAKRANLKTDVSRKQSSSNFPKNRHFLCISGGKKCSFFGKLGVRCFLETPVLRFALLPDYRRITDQARAHPNSKIQLDSSLWLIRTFKENWVQSWLL